MPKFLNIKNPSNNLPFRSAVVLAEKMYLIKIQVQIILLYLIGETTVSSYWATPTLQLFKKWIKKQQLNFAAVSFMQREKHPIE